MARRDPLGKIMEAAVEAVETDVDCTFAHAVGDSPIEKMFFTALSVTVEHIERYERTDVVVFDEQPALTAQFTHAFGVIPQSQIGDYRVDFQIWAYDHRNAEIDLEKGELVYDQNLWRCLVVECDGHNFHERTKEQAAKDRARDRKLSLSGYQVFRFTGSEIWRDPIKCAKDVIAWTEQT